MFILGVTVFFVFLAFIILLSTSYNFPMGAMIFIDAATVFAFITIIASVIIATNSFKTFIVAVNALFSKKYIISASDKEKAIKLCKLLSKTTVYASLLITVIGAMVMLYNLSDPSTIGPSVSIAINAIFVGTIINLIFIHPATHNLESRYNTEERRVISEKQVIDKLMELCYKQGIPPEEILEAEEIAFKRKGSF